MVLNLKQPEIQFIGLLEFVSHEYLCCCSVHILLLLLLLLTANGFIPGGSGATIRHNHKTTHITQHNTPHSK
jgi:hypothetical protein